MGGGGKGEDGCQASRSHGEVVATAGGIIDAAAGEGTGAAIGDAAGKAARTRRKSPSARGRTEGAEGSGMGCPEREEPRGLSGQAP
jgi:hypothetical protein